MTDSRVEAATRAIAEKRRSVDFTSEQLARVALAAADAAAGEDRLRKIAERMAHALDYANVYLPPVDREPGRHPRWPAPGVRPVLSREDAAALADEFYALARSSAVPGDRRFDASVHGVEFVGSDGRRIDPRNVSVDEPSAVQQEGENRCSRCRGTGRDTPEGLNDCRRCGGSGVEPSKARPANRCYVAPVESVTVSHAEMRAGSQPLEPEIEVECIVCGGRHVEAKHVRIAQQARLSGEGKTEVDR